MCKELDTQVKLAKIAILGNVVIFAFADHLHEQKSYTTHYRKCL